MLITSCAMDGAEQKVVCNSKLPAVTVYSNTVSVHRNIVKYVSVKRNNENDCIFPADLYKAVVYCLYG